MTTLAPRIHRAIVRSISELGPGMLRITLAGDGMCDYPTTHSPDEYVRLFFPDVPEQEPRLPRAHGRGWEYDEGVAPSIMRTYTIRAHRPGEVDIDFVRHEGGFAAAWAERVEPDGVIGLSTPFAQFVIPRGTARLTLVADATALPAIERIVEEAEDDLEIRLFCEVADERDTRVFSSRPVHTTWLPRSGNGLFPSHVASVFLHADVASDGTETVWVAGESAMTRRVRKHLRHTLLLPPAQQHIVGYWTDREEAWQARFDALDTSTRERLDTLFVAYRNADDREAVLDEIYSLYESVGL